MILGRKLKADAEAYLGEKVSRGCNHSSAYFSDAQKQATRISLGAGLDVRESSVMSQQLHR